MESVHDRTKVVPKRRARVHYVNNRDFYDALVEYKKNPDGKVPDYIGVCIMQICNKLSTKSNFAGYTYRDEMVDDAMENCVKAIPGFDPEKSQNPFAYFTRIAWNAFIRRIGTEKKETYVKHKNMVMSNVFGELNGYPGYGTKPNKMSDEIIRSFEEKMQLTKNKKDDIKGVEKFIEVD